MSEEIKKIKISDLPTSSSINDEDIFIKSDNIETSKIAADDIAEYVTKKVPVYTHPDSGIVSGTYRSVTVDEQGHVTAGTNPSTLSEYGITDALSSFDVHEWAKAETKPAYTAGEIGADESGSANTAYENAKSYTDTKIAELINGAPSTLDTLGEIADAMSDNQDVVEALDSAIGTKADQAALNEHTGNAAIHTTAAEKTKLSGIETGAQKNTLTGVKGNAESSYRTGNVNITPANIGLGSVNNTADSEKSVKYASSAGSVAWNNVSGKPSSYTPGSHTHDDRYYTESEVNNLLNGKADSNHSHSYLPLSGGDVTGDFSAAGIALKNGWFDLWYQGVMKGSIYTNTVDNILTIRNNVSGYIELMTDGAVKCITIGGAGWCPITASGFNTASSIKYKKNIENMSDECAKKILKLRPVSYDYIKGDTDCLGLIAEEVAEVQEYAVYRNPDKEIEGLDYSKFVPQLIRMVQLQQEEIDWLKEKIQ